MTRPSWPALLGTVGTSAGAARALWSLRGQVPGGQAWLRTNHRGETLTLVEGPAWAAGALAGLLAAPHLRARTRAAAVLATAAGAGFGVLDDLTETGSTKGLRGHLGALRRGELTTGGMKILGISGAGLLAAGLLLADEPDGGPGAGSAAALVRAVDVAVAGGVVAGSANLLNLLDLRPGRALKVALVHAPGLLTPAAAGTAAVVGASLALIGPDLDEQGMLGDCGANALGALLGTNLLLATAGAARRRSLRAAALAGLCALTIASEKISFTAVIASTPVLRELDGLGRRPAAPTTP